MEPFIVVLIDRKEWHVFRRVQSEPENEYTTSSEYYYVPHAATGDIEESARHLAEVLNRDYYEQRNIH